jgi:hypothetical protein
MTPLNSKKPTQVEMAALLSARDVRMYEIQAANGLSVLAQVLDSKRHNQKVYVVSVIG